MAGFVSNSGSPNEFQNGHSSAGSLESIEKDAINDANATVPGILKPETQTSESSSLNLVESEQTLLDIQTLIQEEFDRPQSSGEQVDSNVGRKIGSFQIDSVIASGGMGTVYRATQTDPVRRTVALKMIRSGMADEITIQRFHAERQALALMDHPDIAKVYEANTSEEGHPYFAMEFCEGAPIDQFVQSEKLDIPSRVELVIRIARAVQNAHNRGVIHRDLKPDNILVTRIDGQPNIKIIDFGIAKFTDEQWKDIPSNATRIGELVGTPAYMSPEQARGEKIDGRTDVFAIGAILFKLLTGTTPMQTLKKETTSPSEKSNSLAEIISRIQNFEPTTPSGRLAEASAKQKSTIVKLSNSKCHRTLRRQLRGDLDWITFKAIQNNKLERYATAGDLADDLKRFLYFQPVKAAKPSQLYRIKKLYRRRRGPILAASLIAFTIFASLTVMGVDYWNQARRHARNSNRILSKSMSLIHDAELVHIRARNGGPNFKEEFASAQNLLARAESTLSQRPSFLEPRAKLKAIQTEIQNDLSAFELANQLEVARDYAKVFGSNQSPDLFGRKAGLRQMREALNRYGIEVGKTEPELAAKKILAMPENARQRLIGSLDFLIDESPLGAGIYLHHQDSKLSIAKIIDGSPAMTSGKFEVGDRILAINDVDFLRSHQQPLRKLAYRELFQKPGSKIRIQFVRTTGRPQFAEIESAGHDSHWGVEVLQIVDQNRWRTDLRKSILTADLTELHRLAEMDELKTQRPFNLIQLASMLYLLERSQRCEQILLQCQQRFPDNYWVNYYLGINYGIANAPPDTHRGLQFLTAAVALRPLNVGARLNLAHVYLLDGDRENYSVHCELAKELEPSITTQSIYFDRDRSTKNEISEKTIGSSSTGYAESDLNSYRNKIDSIEKCESIACQLASAGKRDIALKLVELAEKKFEGHRFLARTKGIVLINLQDYVAARIVLSDAARSTPTDAASRFYHGFALEFSGDSQGAIHEYRAAIQLRPDYKAVRDALKRVELQKSGDKSKK